MPRWKSKVGMPDFNPAAASHPCMSCEYGGMWKEAGKPAGNYCIHPKITVQKGLALGRYHSLKRIPAWCREGVKADGRTETVNQSKYKN